MSTMLLIRATDYRGLGTEAVNTLVLPELQEVQPYLSPQGPMSPWAMLAAGQAGSGPAADLGLC